MSMKTISVSRQQIITALRPNNAIEQISYYKNSGKAILSVITSIAKGYEEFNYYEEMEVMFYDADSALSRIEFSSNDWIFGTNYECREKDLQLDPLSKYYLVAGNKCPVFTYFAVVSIHGMVRIYRAFNTKKLEAYQMSLRKSF